MYTSFSVKVDKPIKTFWVFARHVFVDLFVVRPRLASSTFERNRP